MTAFEPGSVVRLDGRKGNDFLLFRTEEGWVDAEGDFRPMLTDRGLANEVRTLVVIDPEDREQVERLLAVMSTRGWSGLDVEAPDDMQAALREFANPTPPKPEEPTGLGAVVEDADGVSWVRVEPFNPGNPVNIIAWRSRVEQAAPKEFSWPNVAAVRVLSEGVTP